MWQKGSLKPLLAGAILRSHKTKLSDHCLPIHRPLHSGFRFISHHKKYTSPPWMDFIPSPDIRGRPKPLTLWESKLQLISCHLTCFQNDWQWEPPLLGSVTPTHMIMVWSGSHKQHSDFINWQCIPQVRYVVLNNTSVRQLISSPLISFQPVGLEGKSNLVIYSG